MAEETLHQKLSRQLDEVDWSGLREHVARDGIIMCSLELDLIETAIAVAEDRADWVSEQVSAGLIGKPTPEQLSTFEAHPNTLFRFLIVQPFVLVQQLSD